MGKIFKFTLSVVIIAILLLSFVYMCSEHEYELADIEEIKTEKEYENIVYERNEKNEEQNFLGEIIIEKIGLKAFVKEGSTQEVLRKYIGHISETAKYDGNIGLAAHNRGNQYSYFARINELKKGDIIIYKTKFYERTYKVNKKVVIYDTDWSYLHTTQDNRITMITCIKNKPNQRLCVQAIEEK